MRAGAAMEKLAFGNTMAPEPPQAQLNNVPAWRASHENACAQLEHQHNWYVSCLIPDVAALARVVFPRSGCASFQYIMGCCLSPVHARGVMTWAGCGWYRCNVVDEMVGCGGLAAIECGKAEAWVLAALSIPSCKDLGLCNGSQGVPEVCIVIPCHGSGWP